ncbi:MAG: NusG domain II-containing protein [Eubacteriales bacterium]
MILAIVVAVLAAVLLLMNVIGGNGQRKLVITIDGQEYQTIALTEETNMHFTVETPYGYNEVVITDGVVDVVSSDCHNQVCVDTHPASKVYDKIVCLPHKLILEIVGDDGEVIY